MTPPPARTLLGTLKRLLVLLLGGEETRRNSNLALARPCLSPNPPSRLNLELRGAKTSPGLSCGRQQQHRGFEPLVQPHPAPPEEGRVLARDQALEGARGSGSGSRSYGGSAVLVASPTCTA